MVATCAPGTAAAAGVPVSATIGQKIGTLAASEYGKHCSDFRTGCVGPSSSNSWGTAWCSTFAQWVWIHADSTIEFQPITTDAGSFALSGYGNSYGYGRIYGTASMTPAVGDAVVFTSVKNDGSKIVHVRIVTSVAGGTVTAYGGDEGGTSGLTATVGKDTWSASAAQGTLVKGQYLYEYIAPVTKVAVAISPSSQSVIAGNTAKWTVSWSGGSGSYSLAFSNGDLLSSSWSATAAGSTSFSDVFSVYPCPGDPTVTITQTFTVTDSKYPSDKATVTSTTRVNPGRLC
jgi:hypothetical protein